MRVTLTITSIKHCQQTPICKEVEQGEEMLEEEEEEEQGMVLSHMGMRNPQEAPHAVSFRKHLFCSNVHVVRHRSQ